MRAFFGIALPAPQREALAELREALRPGVPRASWVKTESFHVTLRFLGDCDATTLDSLRISARDALHGNTAFRLQLAGVGVFPNARKPEVIWAGLAEEGRDALVKVQGCTESAARTVGLPPESKRFHAHATLARVRQRPQIARLQELLEQHANFDGGEFSVEAVTLFRSELCPGGPIYHAVDEIPLLG